MATINKHFFIWPRKLGRRPANYPLDSGGHPMRLTRVLEMELPPLTVKGIQAEKKESTISCMSEMMTLLECFSAHEFDKKMCQSQAQVLEKCYATHAARVLDRRLSAAKKK